MNTLFVGKNFVDLAEATSTNAVAGQLAGSGAMEGTVVQARHQTAGRGQQGSSWHAQAGLNLTFSIILYPTFLAARQVFLLNKLVTHALRAAVAELLPDHVVQIKWPNDLLIDRRKVSGILIETSLEGTRINSAVVGIGLNVNQVEFAEEMHGRACSLATVAGHSWDVDAVRDRVLAHVEAAYMAVRAGRAATIEREYLAHLLGYQEDVVLEVDGQIRTLHLVGVDPDGRLAVQDGGKLYFYAVKEVKFIL